MRLLCAPESSKSLELPAGNYAILVALKCACKYNNSTWLKGSKRQRERASETTRRGVCSAEQWSIMQRQKMITSARGRGGTCHASSWWLHQRHWDPPGLLSSAWPSSVRECVCVCVTAPPLGQPPCLLSGMMAGGKSSTPLYLSPSLLPKRHMPLFQTRALCLSFPTDIINSRCSLASHYHIAYYGNVTVFMAVVALSLSLSLSEERGEEPMIDTRNAKPWQLVDFAQMTQRKTDNWHRGGGM